MFFVFLIAVIISGCGNLFLGTSRREPVAQPAPTRPSTETQATPRSDRIRDGNTQTPERSAAPPGNPQSLSPTSMRPSESAPAPPQEEPDPRAVIDWLLKEKR